MKALILVGGYGTRLRPLTFTCCKPLVEFANKAILEYQIEALAKVGCTEIILAIAYKPEEMKAQIENYEQKYKVKIFATVEDIPFGTAGPIKLAESIIKKDNYNGILFVFNSDVLCEFPLQELVDFHRSHKKEGTILVTKVKDPSKFGVVLYEENGKINKFIEKPLEWVGDRINAGLYCFNTSIIDRIPNKPTSIEREIFPIMSQEENLYALDLKGFWQDVGQPKDYIVGINMYLNSVKNTDVVARGENIIGNVIIHPSAKVHPSAVLGPDTIVGENCIVESGVKLQKTCLFKGSRVKANTFIDNSIIGWNSTIGQWVRIEGTTVIGEDVNVKDNLFINGCKIAPHLSIGQSHYQKETNIM